MTMGIAIDIRIGLEKYAYRRWPAVPRVDDCILLNVDGKRFPADHQGSGMFVVRQVTWGTEGRRESELGDLQVTIHVEFVPPPQEGGE